MEKIGHLIEEIIQKGSGAPSDGQPPNKTAQKQAQAFINIFKRLEELANDEKISLRVRILVKNMLDNRAQGWEKTKK